MYFSDDAEVARKISDKLRKTSAHGISVCNIVQKAQEVNRKMLAIMVTNINLLYLYYNYNFESFLVIGFRTKSKFTSTTFTKIG